MSSRNWRLRRLLTLLKVPESIGLEASEALKGPARDEKGLPKVLGLHHSQFALEISQRKYAEAGKEYTLS